MPGPYESVKATINSSPELAQYNATLPTLSLSPEFVKTVFDNHQEGLRVIGSREQELLAKVGSHITSLELALILTGPATEVNAEESKMVTSDLFMGGLSLIAALDETTKIEEAKTARGFNEAHILFDSLVPDPVLAAPGKEFIDHSVKAFTE